VRDVLPRGPLPLDPALPAPIRRLLELRRGRIQVGQELLRVRAIHRDHAPLQKRETGRPIRSDPFEDISAAVV